MTDEWRALQPQAQRVPVNICDYFEGQKRVVQEGRDRRTIALCGPTVRSV